jgi:hypothetical protein
MTDNYVDKCLRCGNETLISFKREDFPGMKYGQISNEDIAVWCENCGIIYDDWGIAKNRIRILRILPRDICASCGTKMVMSHDNSWNSCEICDIGGYTDEFGWFLEGTRGWVNAIRTGKFQWKDHEKLFVKVERNEDGMVKR